MKVYICPDASQWDIPLVHLVMFEQVVQQKLKVSGLWSHYIIFMFTALFSYAMELVGFSYLFLFVCTMFFLHLNHEQLQRLRLFVC